MSHTRPDIVIAISMASLHMHSPKEADFEADYKSFRYLKGSPGRDLFLKKNKNRGIKAFTDTNCAGSIEDISYVFGNLVYWRSKAKYSG